MNTMPTDLQALPPIVAERAPCPTVLEIATFSYEDRHAIFPAVAEALELCGCWLLERRQHSLSEVEFRFELHLRSVLDLYAALIAAGLELTRDSHQHLTVLWTLRRHEDYPNGLAGVINVSLMVKFLEECEPTHGVGQGAVRA